MSCRWNSARSPIRTPTTTRTTSTPRSSFVRRVAPAIAPAANRSTKRAAGWPTAGRHAAVRWAISQARSSRDGPWLVCRTWYHAGQLSKARSKRDHHAVGGDPREQPGAGLLARPPPGAASAARWSASATTGAGSRELTGEGMIRPRTTITAYSKGMPGPLARDHCTRIGGRCISSRSTSSVSRIWPWIWSRSRERTEPREVRGARAGREPGDLGGLLEVVAVGVRRQRPPASAARAARARRCAGRRSAAGAAAWMAPSSSHGRAACPTRRARARRRRSGAAPRWPRDSAQSGAPRRASGGDGRRQRRAAPQHRARALGALHPQPGAVGASPGASNRSLARNRQRVVADGAVEGREHDPGPPQVLGVRQVVGLHAAHCASSAPRPHPASTSPDRPTRRPGPARRRSATRPGPGRRCRPCRRAARARAGRPPSSATGRTSSGRSASRSRCGRVGVGLGGRAGSCWCRRPGRARPGRRRRTARMRRGEHLLEARRSPGTWPTLTATVPPGVEPAPRRRRRTPCVVR